MKFEVRSSKFDVRSSKWEKEGLALRMKCWFCALFVFALATALTAASAGQGASTPAPQNDGKRELTITGCLLRSGYAGFQIDEARLDVIDGKPVAEGKADASWPKKWILEGGGNLAANTGRKVQVVGRSEWQPASPGAPADEPPNRTPHLDVKSVKMIAPECQ
jgi:hypothetical protein